MTGIDIRALTVRQPWAACIASGAKTVENRGRNSKYRGLVAIHSSLAWDVHAHDALASSARIADAVISIPDRYYRSGVVLAVVDLLDAHPYAVGCCDSPWGDGGKSGWHWVLGNVRELPYPVPATGRLGLWRPDVAVVRQITAQLELEVAS